MKFKQSKELFLLLN